MKIALLEPFFGGSHQQWSEGLQKHSAFDIRIFSLPGRHWKWRMYGGAVSLARQFLKSDFLPDLILATDMLDLTTFLAMCRKKLQHTPVALYFHENQITYPWSPDDPDLQLQRNNQYGFINFTSALAADRIFFNSNFHQQSFLESLPGFLKQFPDHQEQQAIAKIKAKSGVLPLGLELKALSLEQALPKPPLPVFLWNHRWEFDKNPDDFFDALFTLKADGYAFRLIVLGQSYQHSPAIFSKAKEVLAKEILHWGFAKNRKDYARFLHLADVLPVSSQQDFFGISAVEAIYCNSYPILPNRLAFPEHIPADKQAGHLYQNQAELITKMKWCCQQIEEIRRAGSYQNFVAHYDWSILATEYDRQFAALIKKGENI